jgi:hypothetical protein
VRSPKTEGCEPEVNEAFYRMLTMFGAVPDMKPL